MNKKEVVLIAQMISAAYPNAKFDVTKLTYWEEMLEMFDYESVRHNTKNHILHSEYAPTIADIVKMAKETHVQVKTASRRSVTQVEKAEQEAEQYLKRMGLLD